MIPYWFKKAMGLSLRKVTFTAYTENKRGDRENTASKQGKHLRTNRREINCSVLGVSETIYARLLGVLLVIAAPKPVVVQCL